MATGDQSGNWGNTTNVNLGTLIEQAISGYTTQVFVDSDVTLTMTAGVSAIARNMYLECTGTNSTTRNLIVPSNKKLYFIYNNTIGGFSLTVKVLGQTGVTVPNGQKALLVCNGTDVVSAVSFISIADINGGTIDSTVIGGTSAAAGSFTTLTTAVPTVAASATFTNASGTTTFVNNIKTSAVAIKGSTGTTDYEFLDFLNSGNNLVARIGVLASGSGSTLYMGTSNAYASGITNQAFSLDYLGRFTFGAPVSGDTLSIVTLTSSLVGVNISDSTNYQLRVGRFGTSGSVAGIVAYSGSTLVLGAGNIEVLRLSTLGSVLQQGTNAGGSIDNQIQNLSNNATSQTRSIISNDTGRSLVLDYTSSARATAVLTGGPTTEQAAIYTSGNFPISLGVSATETMRITINSILGQGPVAGTTVDMTPDSGSFTGTLTGCTSSPTATFVWRKMGNVINIDCPTGLLGTSNAATCTITGIPAAIAPSRNIGGTCLVRDNGVNLVGMWRIQGGATVIEFGIAPYTSYGSMTSSGSKGLSSTNTFTYSLI